MGLNKNARENTTVNKNNEQGMRDNEFSVIQNLGETAMNFIVASGDIYLQENQVHESQRMSVMPWLKSLGSMLVMKHLIHMIVVIHTLHNLSHE
jgi:hypothetical protein